MKLNETNEMKATATETANEMSSDELAQWMFEKNEL